MLSSYLSEINREVTWKKKLSFIYILALSFCVVLTGCNERESEELRAEDITINIKVRAVNDNDVSLDVKMHKANNPLLTVNLTGEDQLLASNGIETIELQSKTDEFNLIEYEGRLPLRQESSYQVIFSRNDNRYESSVEIPTLLNIVSPLSEQFFRDPFQEFRLAWEANVLEYTHLELELGGACRLSNDLTLSVSRVLGLTPDANEYFSPIASLIDFDELLSRVGINKNSKNDIKVESCDVDLALNAITQKAVNADFRGGTIRGIKSEKISLSYLFNE